MLDVVKVLVKISEILNKKIPKKFIYVFFLHPYSEVTILRLLIKLKRKHLS